MEIGKDIRIIDAKPSDTFELVKVKERYGLKNVAERFQWLEKKVDGRWLLLKRSDNIIGWCVVMWKSKKPLKNCSFLQDLYIRPEHRNKGYGTYFIGAIEEMVKEKGYSMIGLAVNPDDNQAAYRLYERLGYRHDGTPRYIDGIYDGYEDWVIDLIKQL